MVILLSVFTPALLRRPPARSYSSSGSSARSQKQPIPPPAPVSKTISKLEGTVTLK
jgi:hypothetical protein